MSEPSDDMERRQKTNGLKKEGLEQLVAAQAQLQTALLKFKQATPIADQLLPILTLTKLRDKLIKVTSEINGMRFI